MKGITIEARRTRKPTRCLHCGLDVPVDDLVHVVADDDGRPRAAHVTCDLRQLDERWKAEREAREGAA